MGQIWAALKSIAVIAEFLKSLLEWVRQLQRKRALDKADEIHANNAGDIDRAFADGVPESGDSKPRPTPAVAPAVPSGQGGGS